MRPEIICALVSVFIISLISLVGISFVLINRKILDKFNFALVSLSVGTLYTETFLHLIPYSYLLNRNLKTVGTYVLIGILSFFTLEKILNWKHSHSLDTCHDCIKPVGYMNIAADGIHNLLDGMIIGSSFLISIPLGISVSTAIAIHELSQEIGEFGVLIHSGFSVKKAMLFNFISACFAILGTASIIFVSFDKDTLLKFAIPFTAGSFLYIAGSDLIPDLHKQHSSVSKSIVQLIFILLGIWVISAIH